MKERGRRQGVKRKDGGERKNSEGRTVFIPRESARTGHANLVRAAACLEAPFINFSRGTAKGLPLSVGLDAAFDSLFAG